MIRLLIVMSVIAWLTLLQRVIYRKLHDPYFTSRQNEDYWMSWFLTIPTTVGMVVIGVLIAALVVWVYNGF